eukprot:m.213039 g.213039  ORF g.213039 m.213039 type:complete len:197 (+) comp39782_c0_seq39:73-663(+)
MIAGSYTRGNMDSTKPNDMPQTPGLKKKKIVEEQNSTGNGAHEDTKLAKKAMNECVEELVPGQLSAPIQTEFSTTEKLSILFSCFLLMLTDLLVYSPLHFLLAFCYSKIMSITAVTWFIVILLIFPVLFIFEEIYMRWRKHACTGRIQEITVDAVLKNGFSDGCLGSRDLIKKLIELTSTDKPKPLLKSQAFKKKR